MLAGDWKKRSQPQMERSDCETLCRGDEKFGKAKGGTEEARTVGESEIKEASKEPKTAGSEIEERIGEGETVNSL